MMKLELIDLGVEPCCQTCQHFKTIDKGNLYRCLKFAFQKVVDGTCPEKEPWANAQKEE